MVFGRREHWVIAGVQLNRAAAWEALQAHSFLSLIDGILLYVPLYKM